MESLKRTADRLEIPIPHYINVSGAVFPIQRKFNVYVYLSAVRKGYEHNIPSLVNLTRDLVEDRLKGDAWIIWAIAQRANVPLKIEACIA